MTGAIAGVSCANGMVHHFVCIKKDATIGHIIATFDKDDKISWSKGDLTGQAHPESRIAIGCSNPTETSSELEVLYHDPSGTLVYRLRGAITQQWDQEVMLSTDSHIGTGLALYYGGDGNHYWQSTFNNAGGTIGIRLKDHTEIPLPLACKFHFIEGKDTDHFYYLHENNISKEIRHFSKNKGSEFWDLQEPQRVPLGTKAFKVVDDSVSIIDEHRQADVPTKSSVRLLQTWLGAKDAWSDTWSDFSAPDTLVNADVGLTVHARYSQEPSVLFTYVDAKSGEWIYLVVKQGQSVGYERAIDIADHWFEASDAKASFVPGPDYPLDPSLILPHEAKDGIIPVAIDKSPTSAAPEVTLPVVSGTQPTAPTTNPEVISKPPKTQPDAPATEVKDDIPDVLEWIRKFCSDRFIPRTDGTINTISRKGLHHDHATLATSSQLWDLGDDPLLYKFMDGKYGGNENQRNKVRKTIPEWSQYANVVFKEAGKDESAPIRITFDPSDGSWAIVGNHSCKEDEGRATMNLGWVNGFNSTLHREEQAVILHEFGHALGMFHEHQSPAHGNQTVVNPKAAIEFYKKTQGWSEEEVMEQVVRPYNENDVSNFSQVDTKSIMHYFQPSEVTSGPPIEYNYVLSELDKAYMVINYPRSLVEEKKRVNDKDWTLEASLKKAGLTDNDPTLAAKILAVRASPGPDGMDVGQIRELFTKWARAQHTIKDNRLRSTTRKYLKGVLEHHHGIELNPEFQPPDHTTFDTPEPDPCPCQSGETEAPSSVTPDPKKARAVVDINVFADQPKFNRPDLDVAPINFTWTIVRDPTVTNGEINRDPGVWERRQVEYAMAQWASYCSVTFTWTEPEDAATTDLIIVFQDINPTDGKSYDADNSANRSYFATKRWDEAGIERSKRLLSQREIGKWRTDHPHYFTATRPPVPHDICYRGIVTESSARDPPKGSKKWPPGWRSARSIVHELGHFFGLDHEDAGLWGMFWGSREGKEKLLAAAEVTHISATVFDTASVMDSLRLGTRYQERVHDWTQFGFKTVFAPSAIDTSNLALFHPGPHLATLDADGQTCILTRTDKGATVLWTHCAILGLDVDLVAELSELAENGEWSGLRMKYLSYHRDQLAKEKKLLEDLTQEDIAAHRKNVPVHVSHGQRMQAAQEISSTLRKSFEAPVPNFKNILWSKLNEVFGPSEGATSFLTVQSPTRYLDKDTFSYKMEGAYSNFVKPVVVNEAEFRLTDQLFDPVRVVGAPNGRSLSLKYEMLLHNLVPRYVEADMEVRKAREKMRRWLVKEASVHTAFFVNDTKVIGLKDNPKAIESSSASVFNDEDVRTAVKNEPNRSAPRVASRMEVCQALMTEYLDASYKWKKTHSEMVQKAMHNHTGGRLEALEDAAREIANYAAVENSKLSAKYADVVVRGHLHTVRECLAQLDMKSSAEFLQDAKDSIRESALSSLYGASRVLPVIMTPTDWAESLDTSFDPHDLSSDPAVIEMSITAKSRQLDTLRNQLGSLQHSAKGDEVSLRKAMDDAADAYSNAQANLAGSYSESARALCMQIAHIVVPGGPFEFKDSAKSDDKHTALESMIKRFNPLATVEGLFDQMGKVNAAHRTMMLASAQYSQRQTDWVRAKSATTAEQEAIVSRAIETATKELDALGLQLEIAVAAKEKRDALIGQEAAKKNADAMAGGKPDDAITLPTMAEIAPSATDAKPTGGSRWISVSIASSDEHESTSSGQNSDVSREDSVNFFGQVHNGDNKASSGSNVGSGSSNLKVEISMNCTMVTVDRSSWFQPEFFDIGDAFMRNNQSICWNKGWRKEWQDKPELAVKAAITKANGEFKSGNLPCFPVGYIIAKDILIKVSGMSVETVADKQYLEEKMNSGSNFLFFSTSKPAQKTQSSSSSRSDLAKDGMVVRIPGPQIIGYIQQMLPWDSTHEFKQDDTLKTDIFLPEDDEIEAPHRGGAQPSDVARALDPNGRPKDKTPLKLRSTNPSTSVSNSNGESEESSATPATSSAPPKPSRAQAPMPGGAGHDGTNGDVAGNGDAGELAEFMRSMKETMASFEKILSKMK